MIEDSSSPTGGVVAEGAVMGVVILLVIFCSDIVSFMTGIAISGGVIVAVGVAGNTGQRNMGPG